MGDISKAEIVERVRRDVEFTLMMKRYMNDAVRPIMRKYSLKFTDVMTIFLIGTNPSIRTATDIARHSDLKRGNISIIIDSLMEQGYIEQEVVKEDRRQKHLHLTPKADPILNDCITMVQQMVDVFIKGIPTEDLLFCEDILLQMQKNLESYVVLKGIL